MNRKGQGISINMVIIITIALLVLIVAAIMILKGGKNIDANAGAKSCLSNGGACRSSCAEGEATVEGQFNCPAEQSLCCRYSFGG